MSNDERRLQLRSKLIDLLGPAAGPDRYLRRDEVEAAGIPRRFVEGVATAGKDVQTVEDAVALADWWATHIDQRLPEEDVDVRSVVESIPRGF